MGSRPGDWPGRAVSKSSRSVTVIKGSARQRPKASSAQPRVGPIYRHCDEIVQTSGRLCGSGCFPAVVNLEPWPSPAPQAGLLERVGVVMT
jgi:hypothetical protein